MASSHETLQVIYETNAVGYGNRALHNKAQTSGRRNGKKGPGTKIHSALGKQKMKILQGTGGIVVRALLKKSFTFVVKTRKQHYIF